MCPAMLMSPMVMLLLNQITAPAGAPVKDVVETLRQSKRNCSLILKDGKLMGIFTDRDILRKVVDRPELWEQAIDQVMTREVLTIAESATAAEAMAIMDRWRMPPDSSQG